VRLGHSELTAISEALRELYAHTDASSLPHCIVRILHRLISANSAVYNSFDFRTGEMFVVHDHGPDGDRYLPALQEHIQEHPLLVYVREHWKDGAAALSDVASHRELRDLPIYSEFLHPLRIEKQLGLLVEDQKYGVTAVALQRDGRDFTKRDKDVLTFLQPHIIQAFKNAADLTALKTRAEAMESVANSCNVGAVWLSRDDKIEWMSNLAELWLAQYFSEPAPAALRARLPPELTAWIRKQKSSQQANSSRGWRAEQTIAGPRGELNVRWIAGQPGQSHLILSEHRTDRTSGELCSLGLTLREAEVLRWVAAGKTNDAISILLSISKRTVEKHVERILAKLSVETRVEAAVRAVQCQRLG
jgi:DNA-binding CsgD family transcriptional regulator